MKFVRNWLIPVLIFSSFSVQALSDLDYLPKSVTYDQAIPLPADVLGSPVGEWHVRHDQLVQYMRVLAEKSDRVSLVETGRTHENRPLLLLAFSSAENQANLSEIQQAHLKRVTTGEAAPDNAPLVLWMGYSVHGNEPSGSNASLLIAYYLAAAQGDGIDSLLNDNVVLLDPSVNPDGLSRFAQWANMHRGKTLVSDPQNREHVEGWPSGRTNHYWFDLNRDWLLLTHPESRARINQFHQWRPHVLTDFHEMGSNSTYFFQPGIASRKNPWTPQRNVELTKALADFHAAALDENKELYFTQEAFDDFYYGKGSTYPDAHGSVGILFEQASSRGHLQETQNGMLAFSDTIQNQVTTSLSTFAGALSNKKALLDFQRQFFNDTKALIKDDNTRGYLLKEENDSGRFLQLQSILQQHQIDFKFLAKTVSEDDKSYTPSNSIFVPLDQPQYRLIKSLFSERKRFNDNTFYDVSAWNLPMAFDVEYVAVDRGLWRKISLADQAQNTAKYTQQTLPDDAYAFAFSWQDYYAPALLQSLLSNDVQVRIAGEAFAATTTLGQVSMQAGSVLVPLALEQPKDVAKIIAEHANRFNIKIWPVTSGLTTQGIDLGSGKMRRIDPVNVLIVGGKGTSSYEAGEAWHYLDQRVGIPASIIELDRLSRLDVSQYTHMIWVSGNYGSVDEDTVEKLGAWLKNGGIMIGQKSASKWFSKNEWLKADFMKKEDIKDVFSSANLSFADRESFAAKQRIAGAIFATKIDTSHPLGFGMNDSNLPVFRNHDLIMEKPKQPFISAAVYEGKPLLSGYTSDELVELIANSAAVVGHRVGKGRIIAFADNVNFRGYWYGTSKLMSNAIFMAPFIDARG